MGKSCCANAPRNIYEQRGCCPPCVAAFGSYYETAAVCFDIDSELKQRVEATRQSGYCRHLKLGTWQCGETSNYGEAAGVPEIYCDAAASAGVRTLGSGSRWQRFRAAAAAVLAVVLWRGM